MKRGLRDGKGYDVKELYTAEEAAAIRARAGRLKARMIGLGLAGVVVCVILCCLVNTANENAIRLAVTAVSAAAGWAVILLWAAGYAPAKANHTHMEGVLGQPRETFEGVLSVEKGALQIPKSIRIRRVTLTDPEGNARALSVLAEKAGELPPEGARVRAETVRKYILAVEVLQDDA